MRVAAPLLHDKYSAVILEVRRSAISESRVAVASPQMPVPTNSMVGSGPVNVSLAV